MVDPSEAEEQNKCKGLDTPAVATEELRLPEQADGARTEDDEDGGFETPPSGSSEPSPCHTATPAEPDGASQGPPPPPPPEQPQTQTDGDPSPKLHLDLYNFDSPVAEGSRYVLTSPHSLEACARCGVKPVELLPRPLADFAREAPGRSMRVATGLFEVYERDRHGKLRQCREERERIVREEKRRILQAAVNTGSAASPSAGEQEHKASSGSSQPAKSGPVTSSSTPDRASRATASGPTSKAPTSSACPKSQSSKNASTTSSLPSRGGFQGAARHSPEVKSTRPLSSGSPAVFMKPSGDHWAKVSCPRARTMATFNSLMGRSLSLGDLSHSLQTTQKVERIVREVRRRGLKAVSERDRKIAALMLARYQEEDIMSQTRYVAHLQWDSERRMDELRREQEDREKQRAVLQCQRMWQTQVSLRQRRLSQQERLSAAAKMRQAEESEERWRELAEQQERNRLLRLQQAAREEKHKKALQEQNLKALEEERAAMLEQERLLLKEKLTMAELKRQEKEHQGQEDRRGLNKAEKRRHAALIQEIARREQEEREEARRAAEEKLNRSLENYEQIVERRGQELKQKAKREEKQIQKARKAAEKHEKQQRQLLEARAKEAEKRAQQAALVAEERAKEKAQRAVQTRQEKEKLQRLNRQRVEDEEKQRRLELLQSIERKLEKSEQIFKEKRAVLESARSVARASFHVRDKVREETNMRTFDKMALEAQLNASLDEK
uniref:Coiled-coil domain-containing protein 177 n=1 Tax=Cyclopterus lumpus TaxID=8103 RepID=A0A8C3A829_CYCLU